jgi:hypothetical protein
MASGRGRRAETSDGQGRGVTSEYAIQLALPAHVPSLPGIERSAASLFDGILSAALLDATTPFSMLEEALTSRLRARGAVGRAGPHR